MRFSVLALLFAAPTVFAQATVPAGAAAPVPSASVAAPRPVDPTVRLYLQAREKLNSGDYREAAALFGQVAQAYSAKGAAADALYWQAFALYRLGTPADLQKARTVLEEQRKQLNLAEKRTLQQFEESQRKTQAAYQEQARASREELEKQRKASRKQFDKERARTAAAFEQQRKEADASQQARLAANVKFLAEQEERNRESLARLDEQRKQTLASYEEQNQLIGKNYEEQQKRNRQSRATLQALERQKELSLKALEEQRAQSQAQFEAQRQQFLDAFERQRAQTQAALEEQQTGLARAQTTREQENKQILEEIERRNRQQLLALESSRESLQRQFEQQMQMTRDAHDRQVRQIGTHYNDLRQQSLTLSQRIAGDLAQGGDQVAATAIIRTLDVDELCANEAATAVRLESMNALAKVKPEAVRPVLQQILDPKNKCSRPMRERAVFLLALQSDQPAADMLIKVVRVDPDMGLRQQALMSMRRSPVLEKNSRELVRLYDVVKEREIKQQLIVLYSRSRTPLATTKLITIVEKEKDPMLRQQSIAVLGGVRDPRVQEVLQKNAGGGK